MKVSGRRPLHFLFHLLLSAVAWTAVNGSGSAQSIYGSIRGLVTDPSSASIAGAKVRLINEGTSDQRSAVSNSLGEYVFSQVIPGTYSVSVESQGFKKVERKGIDAEQVRFTAKHIFASNHVPSSRDVTHALLRRLRFGRGRNRLCGIVRPRERESFHAVFLASAFFRTL